MASCSKSESGSGAVAVPVGAQFSAQKPLRIALIEDDERLARLFAETVAATPDLRLAGHAPTLAAGVALLQGSPANVMLVDLGLPDGSGVELIRAAREHWPSCEIMVFTVFGDETSVIQSIEAGARGYLLKDCPPARVVEEIRTLHAGGSPISPRIARHVLTRLARGASNIPSLASPALSKRELEVLHHIARGFTYDEIAQRMAVSRHTVLTYVRRIYAKLEVGSKIEALNKARSKGLITD
jgi:DNA-binding NarL/FixJ family response regulator